MACASCFVGRTVDRGDGWKHAHAKALQRSFRGKVGRELAAEGLCGVRNSHWEVGWGASAGSLDACTRTLNLVTEGCRNSAPAPLNVRPDVHLLLPLPRRLEPIGLLLARARCPRGLLGLYRIAGAVAVAAVQHDICICRAVAPDEKKELK